MIFCKISATGACTVHACCDCTIEAAVTAVISSVSNCWAFKDAYLVLAGWQAPDVYCFRTNTEKLLPSIVIAAALKRCQRYVPHVSSVAISLRPLWPVNHNWSHSRQFFKLRSQPFRKWGTLDMQTHSSSQGHHHASLTGSLTQQEDSRLSTATRHLPSNSK